MSITIPLKILVSFTMSKMTKGDDCKMQMQFDTETDAGLTCKCISCVISKNTIRLVEMT